MIKFKQGYIATLDGVSQDIIVKSAAPNTLRDGLIGCGIVMAGIAYLTVTAFKNGAKKFEVAETKTLEDLGLIKK